MLIRCPNCGWKGRLSPEQLTAAVGAAAQKKAVYHIEACPRCQWLLHVRVADMQAALENDKPAGKSAGRKRSTRRPATRKTAAAPETDLTPAPAGPESRPDRSSEDLSGLSQV